ncbi:MAG: hypothetical protein AAF909_14115 [Pseudomonadota bacterium]
MNENDLLSLATDGTEAVLTLVSTAFAFISAYIAGLYFFLRKAPLALRLASFALLSVTLSFLGIIALGLLGILYGADVAWRELDATATNVTSLGGERPDFLMGLSVYEAGAASGFLAFSLLYLALGFMTFFYRWRD